LKSHKYQRKKQHAPYGTHALDHEDTHPTQKSRCALRRCSRPLCSSQRTVSPANSGNTSTIHEPEDHHHQTTSPAALGLQNPIMCTQHTHPTR